MLIGGVARDGTSIRVDDEGVSSQTCVLQGLPETAPRISSHRDSWSTRAASSSTSTSSTATTSKEQSECTASHFACVTKKNLFLVGVFTPLDMGVIEYLRDRGADCVGQAVQLFVALAKGRDFDVLEIRCDGEGAVGAITAELNLQGIKVPIAGPRKSQTVKGRHRCHELSLPFVRTKLLIIWCTKFSMHCVNLHPSANATDTVCPHEQFSGIKVDTKRDLRVAFGDFVIATPAETNNSMEPRSEPHIALGGRHNLTGSVWMLPQDGEDRLARSVHTRAHAHLCCGTNHCTCPPSGIRAR